MGVRVRGPEPRKGDTMVSPEINLQGLQLVGRFGGVDESQAVPAVLVDFDYRDGEGKLVTATRRAEYSAYSSKTGEITPVGECVGTLHDGDRIAISVWINGRGARLTYRAQEVVRLDAAEPVEGLHSLPGSSVA